MTSITSLSLSRLFTFTQFEAVEQRPNVTCHTQNPVILVPGMCLLEDNQYEQFLLFSRMDL